MKLALIFGNKGNNIKPKILQVKDNLVIDCFNSVEDMISNSKQRDYLFDRIVVLSTILKLSGNEQTEIDILFEYWKSFAPKTNIICLCNSGKDDELASMFTNKFSSTLCTSMSVSATTINILVEAATDSIQLINSKYGLKTDDVEIEMDTIVLPEEPNKEPVLSQKEIEEQRKKERHEARARERELKAQNKQKKGGLFGLFGGKKKDEQPKQNIVQSTEQSDEEQYQQNMQYQNSENSPQIDDEDWEGQYEQNIADSNTSDVMYETEEIKENNGVVEEYVPEELPDDFGDSDSSMLKGTENFEDNNDFLSSNENINEEQDFSENSTDTDFVSDNTCEDNISSEESEFDDTNETDSFIETSFKDDSLEESALEDNDFTEESFANEEITEETDNLEISEDYYVEDEEDLQTVDEDLSDIEIPEEKDSVKKKEQHTQPDDAEEVDVELGGLDVGNLDASYRDKTEAPKVIEKEVVKEVVKEVRIKSSVLDNIYSGNTSKIILVTGDRGSGITTLALDIAYAFAKHTHVLYVDGDTELHGLLNYIDYDAFREYEDVHMQGIKLCRSSKAFKNCRLNFDNNLDLLTSNFGVQVSDEELELAQSVVAEISSNYGVVVVDCPIDKINCFHDLILQGNVVLCVEATKRGFMNTLCKVEDSELPLRYKRSIVGKGTMVMTKIHPKLNMKQLVKYVKNIVEFDEVDWLSMNIVPREATITDKFLSEIIEG